MNIDAERNFLKFLLGFRLKQKAVIKTQLNDINAQVKDAEGKGYPIEPSLYEDEVAALIAEIDTLEAIIRQIKADIRTLETKQDIAD